MSNIEEINEGVLLAYLNRELSNEDMVKVDLWLAKSSKNLELFNEVRDTWKLAGRLKSKPANVNTDKAWENVLSQINTSTSSSGGQVVQMKPQRSRIMVMIAASIVMLIGAAAVMVFIKQDVDPGSGMLELHAGNDIVSENLPDGSHVTLNEKSVLEYPPQFEGAERKVILKGECFFDVARDETKPFIIDLPDKGGYVKVLGTSFNIKADEGSDYSEVFVSSGKVEFGSEKNKVILVAGQKAIMDNATGDIEKVEEEVYDAAETFWIDKTLDFNGETMTDVVEILNYVYKDEIVLECEELNNRRVNSTHRDESLESVLITLSELYHFESISSKSDSGTVYHLKCK